MTIDEAIAHAEWAADNCEGECAEEHKQLAKWLRELRDIRSENKTMRTMIQGYVDDYTHDNCGSCYGGLCEDCDCWLSNSVDELHDFGIEVG